MTSVGRRMMVVCRCWHRLNASTGDTNWSQVVPGQRRIKESGCGVSHISHHRRWTLQGKMEKSGGGGGDNVSFALWAKLRLIRNANLCGPFLLRSWGQAPDPSTQTQWNICSPIIDFSPEGFQNGHNKTNSFLLVVTPLTTGVLTTPHPHLGLYGKKIPQKENRKKKKILFYLFWKPECPISLCNGIIYLMKKKYGIFKTFFFFYK